MSEFDLKLTPIPVGLSLIEAGAGTGKTWTLSHLLPRLLIQGRLQQLDQAVLVTFTDDAARELAERVRQTLGGITELVELDLDADPLKQPGLAALLELWRALPEGERASARRRLQNARDSSDRLLVSTIHSFCRRVLTDQGFLCGMPVGFGLLTDPADLKEQALRDVWRADLGSDALLAGLAARDAWKLDEDLQAWRLAEALDELRLHPQPLSLAEAKAAVVAALAALKAQAVDLVAVQAALKQAEGQLSIKAQPGRAAAWGPLLQGLDPQAPSLEHWLLVEDLQAVGGWPKGNTKAGKEAKAQMQGLALLDAAQALPTVLQPLRWAWTGHVLAAAAERLQAELRRGNLATYDDLIRRLHLALQRPKTGAELALRLRARWRVALVDESQDTDPRQWAIFSSIFLGPQALDQSLVLIGDPKQAIYGFRGADLQAYLGAKALIKDEERRSSLTKTQRSAPSLVDGFNALWGRLDQPLASAEVLVPKASSARSDGELPLPADGLGRLVAAAVDEQEGEQWDLADGRLERAAAAAATAIVDLLASRLPEGPVLPRQCVVLTRSNREALATFEALRQRGVSAVVRDDGDVLQMDEARDLGAVLAACLQPGRQGLRRHALATRLLGLDAKALLDLDEPLEELWQRRLAAWGELWRKRGIAALLQAAEEAGPGFDGFSANLARDVDGERRLTDLRHLSELLQTRETSEPGGPERLLHWLDSARAGGERDTKDERLRRLDRDGEAVQILTMHRAKGLEYDFVFCPYLWSVHKEGRDADAPALLRLPDQTRALTVLAQADDSSALRGLQRREQMQEQLRLLYVALTRAKRRVWFLAGYIGYGKPGSSQPPTALDWLLGRHQPGEGFDLWYARIQSQKVQPKKGEQKTFTCEHLEVLAELQAQAPGIFSVAPVQIHALAYQPVADAAPEAVLRPMPGHGFGAWRLTSFSRFTSGAGADKERLDPASEAVALEPEPPRQESPVLLAPFPKGRHAGDGLHQVLEHWDFAADPEALIRDAVEEHRLQRSRPEQPDPVALLQEALPLWGQAVLPALGCSLAHAAADPALSEWAFMLPLGPGGLSGSALAEAFAAHAGNAAERAYAQRLQALAPEALGGFLHGFIDRLAVHQGRWAVLDWKSNHLGDLPSHYSPQALWDCAAEHHYLLQVQLYLLALRRHLRLRDPQAQPAAACLVFLRGLTPDSERGVLTLTPSPALLDSLEALFPLAVPA